LISLRNYIFAGWRLLIFFRFFISGRHKEKITIAAQ
jgi:hypothetical protein